MKYKNESNQGWNEIEFLSWEEFRRMAAPILQLEITRLSRRIETFALDQDTHNRLVKARFHMRKFEKLLTESDKTSVADQCRPVISDAILALTPEIPADDSETREICEYVLDRLNYLHMKMDYLY